MGGTNNLPLQSLGCFCQWPSTRRQIRSTQEVETLCLRSFPQKEKEQQRLEKQQKQTRRLKSELAAFGSANTIAKSRSAFTVRISLPPTCSVCVQLNSHVLYLRRASLKRLRLLGG